ncbi:MAG: DNA glycosylase, partial [Verrucomicrobia bacterium]|nr:DNA glycosylase [Verrucomicrobiota bacterium]
MTKHWSPWYTYDDWQPDFISFKETLDGGQAFCWHAIDEHTFEGVVLKIPIRLHWNPDNQIQWSAAGGLITETSDILSDYLGSNHSYKDYYDTLPWRSDTHLKRCIEQFRELRILRQPRGETLLGFLCSATKQIVQIKEMLTLLRDRFGTPLPSGHKALPTWEQLYHIGELELRDCKLGFRAANIKKTAACLAERDNYLESVISSSYTEAKSQLCFLPGVGEKVADCVLLFGYNKLEAFPVDTWVIKVMKRHYGLDNWHPKQVAQFGRSHFGAYAGLAQQFLFAWE